MFYYEEIDLPKFDVLTELQLLENSQKISWFNPSNSLSAAQICLNAAPGYTNDISLVLAISPTRVDQTFLFDIQLRVVNAFQ